MHRLRTLLLMLALGACSNTVVSLHYTPTVRVQPAVTPTIAAVVTVDQRNDAPTRIATIMGGFGTLLRTLDTATPVKDEVAAAFTNGVAARGFLTPLGRPGLQLALVVHVFDADMVVGRTARIDVTMSVLNMVGKSIYEYHVKDSFSDMNDIETGSTENLRYLQDMLEDLLSRTVDCMLDNPGFRRAVAHVPLTLLAAAQNSGSWPRVDNNWLRQPAIDIGSGRRSIVRALGTQLAPHR